MNPNQESLSKIHSDSIFFSKYFPNGPNTAHVHWKKVLSGKNTCGSSSQEKCIANSISRARESMLLSDPFPNPPCLTQSPLPQHNPATARGSSEHGSLQMSTTDTHHTGWVKEGSRQLSHLPVQPHKLQTHTDQNLQGGYHTVQNHPLQNHPFQMYSRQNRSHQNQSDPKSLVPNYTASKYPVQNCLDQNQSDPKSLVPNYTASKYPVQNRLDKNQSDHKSLVPNYTVSNYPVQNHPVPNHQLQDHPVQNHPAQKCTFQTLSDKDQPVQSHPVQNRLIQNYPVQSKSLHNQDPNPQLNRREGTRTSDTTMNVNSSSGNAPHNNKAMLDAQRHTVTTSGLGSKDMSHSNKQTEWVQSSGGSSKPPAEDGNNEVPHSTSSSSVARKPSHGPSSLCQVCEDVAAGFYCGAFVCEACKKFFIRASKQDKQKFVCLRQSACKITKESRVQCQYCRFQKCLQLKMYYPGEGKRSVNAIHVSGIPCRICGSPSSGFHFGALTCEGCKGFFRRMVKEREPGMYKCSSGGTCEISMHTRNMCKACRYQKCLSNGMSVEGSRIGRQSNSVKHAISLEVKKQRLEQQPDQSDCPLVPMPDHNLREKDEKENSQGSSTAVDCGNSVDDFLSASAGTLSSECVMVKEETSPLLTLNNMELTEVLPEVVVKQEEDLFEEEEFISSLQLAGRELAHMCQVERAKSNFLDQSDFENMDTLWKKQMKHFHFHAQCCIRFSKKVPGFRELLLDDQVVLVQNAIYPIVVLNHSRCYELDTGFYNFFNFTRAEADMLGAMCPELVSLHRHFTHMGAMAQIMNISDIEYTLLSCLLLYNIDCPGLQSMTQVDKQQGHIMHFFENYEIKTHPNGSSRFGELMLRISELTLASLQHIQTIGRFLANHPDLQLPQLYQEMFF